MCLREIKIVLSMLKKGMDTLPYALQILIHRFLIRLNFAK